MPKRLDDLQVHEVSGVDRAANRRRFLLAKADGKAKREDGQDFPAGAYAYVPDPGKPSTWKLRLVEAPGAKPTAAQVGRAIAALGKGYRGNKVQIPAADRADVKRKVLAAWRATHPGNKDVPPVLKGARPMPKTPTPPQVTPTGLEAFAKNLTKGLAQMLGLAAPGTIAPDLADILEDEESDGKLDELCCGLAQAIDRVIDTEGAVDHKAAVAELLVQFFDALEGEGLLKAAGIDLDSDGAAALGAIAGTIVKAAKKPKEADDEDVEMAEDEDDEEDGDLPDDEDDDDAPAEGGDGKGKRAKRRKTKKEDTPMAKNQGAAVPEAIQKQLDDLKKQTEDANKRAEAAEALAKQERDKREESEFLAKAQGMGSLPAKAEDVAGILKAASTSLTKAQYDELERILKASGQGLAQSDLFKEYGSNQGGSSATAMAQIEAKASDLQKADPKLTKAQAISKAVQDNPELYKQHLGEMKKGA